MKVLRFEYKAINLMDQICTVEVSFYEQFNEIHLFDVECAIYAEYNYKTKKLQPSDEFLKMLHQFENHYVTKQFMKKASQRFLLFCPSKKVISIDKKGDIYEINEASEDEAVTRSDFLGRN